MALFEIKLKDLKDVDPWGTLENLSLHWFGLTDGFFFMNVGNEKLFCLSEEVLKQNLGLEKIPDNGFYIDYPVVRPYEDILEILPNILQEVPEDVFSYIGTHEKQYAFEDMDWLRCRTLSASHLLFPPTIIFLNHKDKIIIRWNNKNNIEDGIPVWSAVFGEIDMPVNEFISEVQKFHDELMLQMQKRIEVLLADNPLPHVKIDLNGLQREHMERRKSLEIALNGRVKIQDWDEVRDFIKLNS